MINAKEEFVDAVGSKLIKCAYVIHTLYDNDKFSVLKAGYSDVDYQHFLDSLDYEYDDGFGTQELYGNVWLVDGTWFNRNEYDGSECWAYHKCPEIADECILRIEISNEIDLSKKDVCVICGNITPYTIETHIDNRIGYIEGAGQGCHTPIICSQNRAKSVFMLSEAIVCNIPNDADLGHRVREIYWNSKNN